MPATRQISRQSGSDVNSSSRTARSTGTSNKQVGPSSRRQETNADSTTTTSRRTGSTTIAVQTAGPVTTVTNEDRSLTVSFAVTIKGPIPCKEIP
jgi:microcystin-dependent protein